MERGSDEEQEEEPMVASQALNSNQQQQTDASASLDVTEGKHPTVHLLLLAGDQGSCCQGSDWPEREAAEL